MAFNSKNMSSHEEIIDNLKIVCQCLGIKKGSFKKLIEDGDDTVEKLKKATGAGRGDCVGRRCTERLETLVEQYGPDNK